MLIPVRDILGVGRIPSHRSSASKWLSKHDVTVRKARGLGGETHAVSLTELPQEERIAFIKGELEARNIEQGTWDEEAQSAFIREPKKARDRAERSAAIARALVALPVDATWEDKSAVLEERFGKNGTSKSSLKRLLKAIHGVDPINFAPALLPKYTGGTSVAETTEKAWAFFMTTIHNAHADFPLKQAWRDTRDIGKLNNWQVPSYPTFYRRWCRLTEAQRLSARHGKAHAIDRLSQPIHRDKNSIPPMHHVSLDGRTQDFWVDFGDGKATRPLLLALVDCHSNYILGVSLIRSENAVGTVKLIVSVCEKYGIFDILYTDNGSAFSGHLVAGSGEHKFRGKKTKDLRPFGVCKILGIEVKHAIPGNAQAKTAEGTFAVMRQVIDSRPEFKGCHAGNKPGAKPDGHVVPIKAEIAERILLREIERHNNETGRRAQSAKGRSYRDVFTEGISKRIMRQPTENQLFLAGLVYDVVSVDRNGQIKKDNWIYGDHSTQLTLLEYHGKGTKILIGRDPNDFSKPAIAFDAHGNLICENIQPINKGSYDSKDGARDAARNRKEARQAVAAAVAANSYLDDQEFEHLLKGLENPAEEAAPKPQKVVGGRFGVPLRNQAKPEQVKADEQMMTNLDAYIAAKAKRQGN